VAASNVRRSLDLPPLSESVLEILEPTKTQDNGTIENDIRWRRSDEDIESNEEDYVDASGDGEEMIPYVAGNTDDSPLLREIRASCDPENLKNVIGKYLEIGSASHFLFRINVTLQTASREGTAGKFTQCISSPLDFPFADESSKQRVWNTYQTLALRLRLGSATAESMMDAFDMITQDHAETVLSEGPMAPGIGRYCPAISLFEAQANADGIAYALDGSELYFAMNGPDFEL
jgi:hypothetical protein